MKCRHCRKLLSPYVDGEVTPQQATAVEAHVSQCPECWGVLVQLRRLRQELRSLPAAEVKAELKMAGAAPRARARSRWLRPAVAAVCLLLALGALLSHFCLPRGTVASRPPTTRSAAGLHPATAPQVARGPKPVLPEQTRAIAAKTTTHPTWRRSSSVLAHPRHRDRRSLRTVVRQTPAHRETEVVAIYEAGLALAQSGSVRAALRALTAPEARARDLAEPASPPPRVLALAGDIRRATAVYEAQLARLAPPGDGLSPADRERLIGCREVSAADRKRIVDRYLREKGESGS